MFLFEGDLASRGHRGCFYLNEILLPGHRGCFYLKEILLPGDTEDVFI